MKYIIAILVVILLVGGYFFIDKNPQKKLISTVVYRCDSGHFITASYFDGGKPPKVNPGEMPRPTGSVEVALDKEASTTLPQTVSGSGIRYANADESFAFWSKGDEALIMGHNVMLMEYKNCKAGD